MELPDEDLDNIFDEYESRENEGETNGTGNNEETNNETSAGVRVQPTKRVVKNPRLKFNPERLCGERGIPILMDHFKDVKFKGKGHEKEDLDKLLTKLEHWTHRLFPSMKFSDCLHHIEHLGKKRQVKTCVRKIRLDMPILASDFVKDNEDDDVQRNEDFEGSAEIDAFDKLVGENQNFNSLNTEREEETVERDVDSAFSLFPPPSQTTPTCESGGRILGSAGSSLTEEQKERLERNRMLAIERRKARLASVQQNATESASNERTSQEDPITSPLDSPKRSQVVNFDDLLTNNNDSHNNENHKFKLSDPSTENLGMDGLIALVDEEEVNSDKIVSLSREQSAKICGETTEELPQSSNNLKETVTCSAVDNNSNIAAPSDKQGSTQNLELDSLMDLINGNSEESQQNSDLLETVKHDSHYSEECQENSELLETSKDDSHSESLITGEEMDYENRKLMNENSQESQQNSDLLKTVKHDSHYSEECQNSELLETAKDDIHSKNVNTGEEMDYENEKISKEFSSDSSPLAIAEDPSMEIF